MPIRKYISGTAFDPETIEAMAAAFERARTILNLGNPDDDPLAEIVAKKVVSLASQGCLDPR
jgi:hypothetical protein